MDERTKQNELISRIGDLQAKVQRRERTYRRLAMNTVLIQHGFLPSQIHLVIRQEYIDSLRQAR